MMRYLFVGLLAVCRITHIACESSSHVDLNVGFDLKFSYGTAAVSLPNGSVVATIRMDSGPEYQETFRKLSKWSSTHLAPPYATPEERWADYERQMERRARKAVGLPASDDVKAIATLIAALKTGAERLIRSKIPAAGCSLPRLPAIYDEDLYDAFDFAGLDYLQIMSATYHRTLLTYESSAALAGHGLSLCPSYDNPSACNIDDLQAVYYVVEYEKGAIFAYHTLARSAYYTVERTKFDLKLGHDARNDNPNKDYYRSAIREILLQPLLETSYETPTKIILVGEPTAVQDPVFRDVLGEVLKDFFKDSVPEVVDRDPEYVQARGVAEFVRRRPYLEKPTKPDLAGPEAFSLEDAGREQRVLSNKR